MTWYASVEQTPHPVLVGADLAPDTRPITVDYKEGAEIGYRWMWKTGQVPTYPFGHGLSYTSFAYSDFAVKGGDTVTATLTVTNTGRREGADVPQVYLTQAPAEKRQRLLGFERVELKPGESRRVTITAAPRLLAHFDVATGMWKIATGRYTIALGKDAQTFSATTDTELKGRAFGK